MNQIQNAFRSILASGYVRGTITYGLKYTSSSGVLLAGYVDLDWAGNAVDQKSTSG